MRRVKFQFDERSLITREEAERRGLTVPTFKSPLPHVGSQDTLPPASSRIESGLWGMTADEWARSVAAELHLCAEQLKMLARNYASTENLAPASEPGERPSFALPDTLPTGPATLTDEDIRALEQSSEFLEA